MAKNEELKKTENKNKEVSKYDFTICPNCGETEVGRYCPSCGQSNKDFNKPVKEIVGDLLDSINLDVRLLNTIIPFFTKPGFLIQEYFKGRRKKYVPPMRMYMFISILFFFLVQSVDFENNGSEAIKININDTNIPFNNNGDLNAETVSWEKEGVDTVLIKQYLDSSNYVNKEKIKQAILKDSTYNPFKKSLIGGINASEKKEMFVSKFLKNLSYVLFILMPFFALVLAMILWKSKMLYVKHLIFSINFHSYIFGLSSLILILLKILPDPISEFVTYLWWGIPIYLMLSIKRFYHRKYISAFFKTFGALSIYFIVISIVVVAILAFTAKGFYKI